MNVGASELEPSRNEAIRGDRLSTYQKRQNRSHKYESGILVLILAYPNSEMSGRSADMPLLLLTSPLISDEPLHSTSRIPEWQSPRLFDTLSVALDTTPLKQRLGTKEDGKAEEKDYNQ
jgi:hypothetical protein